MNRTSFLFIYSNESNDGGRNKEELLINEWQTLFVRGCENHPKSGGLKVHYTVNDPHASPSLHHKATHSSMCSENGNSFLFCAEIKTVVVAQKVELKRGMD